MAIIVSEETKKKYNKMIVEEESCGTLYARNALGMHQLLRISLSDFEDIPPQEDRDLPLSIFFSNQGTLYEFLTPDNYTEASYNKMKSIAAKNPSFGLYIHFGENVRFLTFVESCRKKRAHTKIGESISEIKDQAQNVLQSISGMNIDPTLESAARLTVSNIIDTTLTQPTLTTLLSKLLTLDGSYLDHSIAVSMISSAIAQHLNLTKEDVKKVALGAMLHDIGNFKIPSKLRDTSSELSGDEIEIMKTHTVYGQEMIENMRYQGVDLPQEVETIIMQHHEKFNGYGYPNRKYGRQEEIGASGIHLFARIVAIANSYVELIELRDKSREIKYSEIMTRLASRDGSYDPFILQKFKEVVKDSL